MDNNGSSIFFYGYSCCCFYVSNHLRYKFLFNKYFKVFQYSQRQTRNAALNDHIDNECRNKFYEAFIKYLSNVIYQSHKSLSFSPSFMFLRPTILSFLPLSCYSTLKTITNVKYYEKPQLYAFRCNAKRFAIAF